ncbi:hypothetical protein PDG61_06385 [Mycolicibacterium sp. BiH015]|uniref:hypothetical protein n=1 Tax=Mycolicibacterium sp. BiH015 TaxID=3018808 RepID=UPI0022E1991B|nr:hypothetical protein [Mycolicibacterium sp. BiH015]MDA2890529.1 hypothetical protein [Mycolicibacterium sp. BiH015]
MTDLATNPDVPTTLDDDASIAEQAPPSTLITEQQVLLGSAAALAGPKVRRSYVAMVRAAFGIGTRAPRPDGLVKPRHYPRHHAFLEDALMSRMMDRL